MMPSLKKVKSQALKEARLQGWVPRRYLVPIRTGNGRQSRQGLSVKTDFKKILDNADIERVKELATPKPSLEDGQCSDS